MFDIGFWELVVVGVVALLVVGPERLPRLATQAGLWFGKLQRFIRRTRIEIENELHQYEIQQAIREQQRKFEELKQLVDETGREITRQLDSPPGKAEAEKPEKETVPGKSAASDAPPDAGP